MNEKDYAKSECGHTVWRRIFLSIAGIGALIAVGMAWLPLRVGLSHFVIEDMHYYMTTARNVVQGQGVTLDGKHPTNGFHPLWMLICGLVHLAVGSRDVLAMHLVLTVCAGFLIATGYVIYRCMDRRAGPILATAFLAWFLCNYRIMAASLGGLETALNGLCISLMAVYLILSGGIDTWRKSVVLGLLLGLAPGAGQARPNGPARCARTRCGGSKPRERWKRSHSRRSIIARARAIPIGKVFAPWPCTLTSRKI